MKHPIDLATNDELVQELAKRFETIVFVGQKEAEPGKPGVHASMWRFKGNPFKCVGVAYNLIHLINEEIEETISELPEGGL